ncbi:hypothetical protein [Kitasatospora cheerisanensis]|uniref:hypothetical protein n=1 Tax=Kitasatospora cheerisanensis TaxID=81942 RepID=UPI00056BC590|nr:hypothetical protein [Kitasatospora cheerisanensis]
MRVFGITYDTGFRSAGTTTREPFDPETVRREMLVIRQELHCDAVRVTGAEPDRLETAARYAADAGLEVWLSPFTNGLTRPELFDLLVDCAGRAEKLRAGGAEVVLLTGSEISLFTDGFLPGGDYLERAGVLADQARFRALLPELHRTVNAFLAEVLAAVRPLFGGPIGYASLPFEGVDWAPFDLVATDAGYRDATNADRLLPGLRTLTGHGRPAAVTEFGCGSFTGAAALGARGDRAVVFDEHGRAARFAEPLDRNEQEQADYLTDLLAAFEPSGLDAAFVQTFAHYHLPGSDDPERDFDRASFGIVRPLPPGRTSTTHPGLPWEPKAAFHALAAHGRDRLRRRP